MEGVRTKAGVFNDVESINFTQSDAQNIIDYRDSLVREGDLKEFGGKWNKKEKAESRFFGEKEISGKFKSISIGNLDSRRKGEECIFVQSANIFGNFGGSGKEETGNRRDAVDLRDETSDDLFRKCGKGYGEPGETSNKKGVERKQAKEKNRFDSNNVLVFRNINL